MEFNSVEFLNIFLPICLTVAAIFPLSLGYSLLFFSVIFYGWNSTIGLILILLSILIVHYTRIFFKDNILLKLFIALLILSPFVFFRSSAYLINLIPSLASLQNIYPESLILPAGVSFYTFQLTGYLFDKKPNSNETHLKHSLLFILFFPQLIAGPIERGKDLIPQIKNVFNKGFKADKYNFKNGIYLISFGLFLKTFFSDILSSTYKGFYEKGLFGALIQVLSNGSVIYFDFLGYSLIAIGLAKLFNINLTLNFRRPYASIDVAEFWRRWHITLTSWFKDYIYKPIASRFNYSQRSIFFSTVLVFLLTAIWHGFGLRFLIWGLGHFILVIISRKFSRKDHSNFSKCIYWLSTFMAVNVMWIFFFYGTDVAREFFGNFIVLKPILASDFNKRSFLLPCAVILSLLLDTDVIVSNQYQIKEEDKNDKLVILPRFSYYVSKLLVKLTNNYLFSMSCLFVSIAFLSYSNTFIYFRF